MTDVERALLGDRAAQERLTEAGVLVPCPMCGKNVANAGTIAEHDFMDEDAPGYEFCRTHYDVVCDFLSGGCGAHTGPCKSEEAARKTWNTRAPMLSSREMEMLHGKENP